MAAGYYDYDDEDCIIRLITIIDFTDRAVLDYTLSITDLSIIVDSMFARLFPDDTPLKVEILARLQAKLGNINLATTTLAWVSNLDIDIIQDLVVVLRDFLYVDAKIGYKKYLDRGNRDQWNRSKEAMLYLQILKLLPPDEYLPPDKMIELEAADRMRTQIYNYLNPQMGGSKSLGGSLRKSLRKSLYKSLGGSLRVNLPENKLTSLDEVRQYLLDFVSHISKYEDDYFIKLISSNLKDLIFKLKKSVNKSTLILISNIVHIIYTILEDLKNKYKNELSANIRRIITRQIKVIGLDKYNLYDTKLYPTVIKIYIPPKNQHDPEEYNKKSVTAIENIRKSMANAAATQQRIEQTATAAREAQVQTTQAKQKLTEAQQLLTKKQLQKTEAESKLQYAQTAVATAAGVEAVTEAGAAVTEAGAAVTEAGAAVTEAETAVAEAKTAVTAAKTAAEAATQAAQEAKDKKVLDAATAQAARKAKDAKKLLPPPPAPPPRTLKRSTSLELITGGATTIEASTGIYRKYLKYKKKYLLLKNKIVNIYIL